jgi:predicted nucleic acid-binding protein
MNGTDEPCIVDTNVWLYALVDSDDSSKTHTARDLLLTQSRPIITSTQVINEVCVNLIRKAGMSEEVVRELTEAFFRRYQVLLTTETLLLKASRLRERHSFSYWDSLIVTAALQGNAAILFSEDMQDGLVVDNTLTISNPFIQPSASRRP